MVDTNNKSWEYTSYELASLFITRYDVERERERETETQKERVKWTRERKNVIKYARRNN